MALDVAIVGAGRAGAELHLPAYLAMRGVRVVAVCDPQIERAAAVAASCPSARPFESLDDALAACRPGLVSVCTPPETHETVAKAAFASGASVLLEKPIAPTVDQAESIAEAAERASVKLGVVHNYKHLPAMQRMMALVERGEVGRVVHIDKTWFSPGDADRMIREPNFWANDLVGGRWAETLPHHLYIPYALAGPMELISVWARKTTDRWPRLPADEVLVTLASPGCTLTIRFSSDVAAKNQPLVVHGSRSVWASDTSRLVRLSSPAGLRDIVGDRLSAWRHFVRGSARRWLGVPRRHEAALAHRRAIQAFVRHVRGECPPPVTWEEAIWTMRLTDQIGRAIEDAGSRSA